MPWKRSDITERKILEVCARPFDDRFPLDETLMRETGAPLKVVWSALEREYDKGNIDCGTSLRGAWLTPKGQTAVIASFA